MVRWMVVLNMRILGDLCGVVVLVPLVAVGVGVEGYEVKMTGVVVAADAVKVAVAVFVVVVVNVVEVEDPWERVGDEIGVYVD